ncbi:MAG: cystathionine gamma-synthase family protein [Pseudomonadales bacterium]|jgi:O-acetylhomoserine (thiol)-lyase|nr:cystathionine gamma-synthase family protein [Pseudomonadales bacterium]
MSERATGFTTHILHADRHGGIEHGSLHKPVHTSVAYGYDDAQELAAVFQGRRAGYSYGRQSNPTVEALQAKITGMEDGVGTIAFATGMGAIGSMLFSLMRAGDHLVSSKFLFGNTNSLLRTYDDLGLAVDFVDATDVRAVDAALREDTRMVFVETIANPRTQIADLEGIGALCRERGVLFVVDNTMTSPWLFRPGSVGAGLVINALTKYIGGHGMALGGAVTDTGAFDWSDYPNIFEGYRSQPRERWGLQQIRKKGLRDFGASLGPEAAHHIAVGAETLALRLDRACATAAALAAFLDDHPRVARVYHPSLASHPQHDRARRLFRHPGALMSFELDPAVDIFAFMNALRVVILSSNLGDTRTLAIPVAHTIYHEMGAARRAEMGIVDSLIRVSVGIEDADDLLGDFEQALARFD